jgi:hypothetical protein
MIKQVAIQCTTFTLRLFSAGKFHRLVQQLNVEDDVHAEVRHQLHRVEPPARISSQSGRRFVPQFESPDEVFDSHD